MSGLGAMATFAKQARARAEVVVRSYRAITFLAQPALSCNGNAVEPMVGSPKLGRRQYSTMAEQHLGVEAMTRRIAPDATKV